MSSSHGERSDDRVPNSLQPNPSPRSKFQVSLIDLIGAVLGLSITFGLATRISPNCAKNEYVLLSLLLVPFVVCLSIRLIDQVLRIVRLENDPARETISAIGRWRRGPVVWRLVAAVLLITDLIGNANSMLTCDAGLAWRFLTPCQTLLPVCGMLVIAGLVIGMRTAGTQSPPMRPTPARLAWIGSIWLALLVLASAMYIAQSPFIVFHAIEAVGMCTRYWEGSEWGVVFRTSNAASVTTLAATSLLIASVAIARSIRDLSGATRRTFSGRPFTLVLLTSVAAGEAGYLLFGVIPALSMELAEGLWFVLGFGEIVAIVVAFWGFSAGFVALGVAGYSSDRADRVVSPACGRREKLWRFSGLALVCFILAVAGTSTLHALARFQPPALFGRWIVIQDLYVNALGLVPDWIRDVEWWVVEGSFKEMNILIFVPCGVWLIMRIVALLTTSDPAGLPAFDHAFSQPQLLRRFAFYSVLLTVLCLSALPILTVTGLVAYGFLERTNDLVTRAIVTATEATRN